MVTELTVSQIDLPEFDDLGRGFFLEAGFGHKFDAAVFRSNWKKLIESGSGKILGVFVSGMLVAILGFVVAPDLCDGKLCAYETFWFSHKDHRGAGLRLIRAYESAAINMGAKRASMVHLENLNAGRLRGLYTRMGFEPAEVHYFKEIA